MEDRGILDNHLDASFAFIINMMNKEKQNFKNTTFPNAQGQQVSALDLTLQLGQKSFEVAKDKGAIDTDEIFAVSVITLFNSLLENIEGVGEIVPGILSLYLTEIQTSKSPEFQVMLLQGVLMCLWYDLG